MKELVLLIWSMLGITFILWIVSLKIYKWYLEIKDQINISDEDGDK